MEEVGQTWVEVVVVAVVVQKEVEGEEGEEEEGEWHLMSGCDGSWLVTNREEVEEVEEVGVGEHLFVLLEGVETRGQLTKTLDCPTGWPGLE